MPDQDEVVEKHDASGEDTGATGEASPGIDPGAGADDARETPAAPESGEPGATPSPPAEPSAPTEPDTPATPSPPAGGSGGAGATPAEPSAPTEPTAPAAGNGGTGGTAGTGGGAGGGGAGGGGGDDEETTATSKWKVLLREFPFLLGAIGFVGFLGTVVLPLVGGGSDQLPDIARESPWGVWLSAAALLLALLLRTVSHQQARNKHRRNSRRLLWLAYALLIASLLGYMAASLHANADPTEPSIKPADASANGTRSVTVSAAKLSHRRVLVVYARYLDKAKPRVVEDASGVAPDEHGVADDTFTAGPVSTDRVLVVAARVMRSKDARDLSEKQRATCPSKDAHDGVSCVSRRVTVKALATPDLQVFRRSRALMRIVLARDPNAPGPVHLRVTISGKPKLETSTRVDRARRIRRVRFARAEHGTVCVTATFRTGVRSCGGAGVASERFALTAVRPR